MSFTRPDLQTIIDRVKGDLKSELSLTAILRRSVLSAIARAVAGVAHMLHGHMVFISKQIFPDQAEQEFLERWAGIFGVDRKTATFTQLAVDFVFTGAATIPVGSSFVRSDGETYTLDAEVSAIGAGTLSGQITADNSGIVPNTNNAEILSFVSVISSVDSDATVTATVTEGEDSETDDSLRSRVIARIQQPPSGGTASDYVNTALSVAGVTRAWVSPGLLGEGTVVIYFVGDNDVPIIPDAPEVAAVQVAIDAFKPVTAEATVVAPVPRLLNVSVSITPNTQAVRDAITSEIEDLILRDSHVSGSFKEVGSTNSGNILISKINEAISIAAGEDDHVLLSPTTDINPTTGEIVTLGTITFSTLV